VATATVLIFAMFFGSVSTASAASTWTPISDNDYIFGFVSNKYSCWSGVNSTNIPFIEVYTPTGWVKAASGQLLPANSDLKTPCGSDFPIAVGYQWLVMAPAPPAVPTNRYSALYREKTPDKVVTTSRIVVEPVTETQYLCCRDKVEIKKVPYISTTKVKGKTVNQIKYKTVSTTTKEYYYEEVTVNQQRTIEDTSTIPGWTGNPGNIYIYSSIASMNNEIASIGSSILCSFGFSSNCKK
jgi:hypothetical protein